MQEFLVMAQIREFCKSLECRKKIAALPLFLCAQSDFWRSINRYTCSLLGNNEFIILCLFGFKNPQVGMLLLK